MFMEKLKYILKDVIQFEQEFINLDALAVRKQISLKYLMTVCYYKRNCLFDFETAKKNKSFAVCKSNVS